MTSVVFPVAQCTITLVYLNSSLNICLLLEDYRGQRSSERDTSPITIQFLQQIVRSPDFQLQDKS